MFRGFQGSKYSIMDAKINKAQFLPLRRSKSNGGGKLLTNSTQCSKLSNGQRIMGTRARKSAGTTELWRMRRCLLKRESALYQNNYRRFSPPPQWSLFLPLWHKTSHLPLVLRLNNAPVKKWLYLLQNFICFKFMSFTPSLGICCGDHQAESSVIG